MENERYIIRTEGQTYVVVDTQTGIEWLCGPDANRARQLALELNIESQLR